MKVLAFIEVLQLGLAILASRSTEGSICRGSHSVQAANGTGLQLAFCWLHTLTSLSQPQETMMELLLLGEKQTQDTHSEWLSSWMVYLHTVQVFHNLMVLSQELETIAGCPRWPYSAHPSYGLQICMRWYL